LIEGVCPCERRRGDDGSARVYRRRAVETDYVRVIENVGRFGDEFEPKTFAKGEKPGITNVELRDPRSTDGVASNEQRPLERAGCRRVAVQNEVAPDVEYVSALHDREYRNTIAVHQTAERLAVALPFRRVNQVSVENVRTICQRVSSVGMPIGRVRADPAAMAERFPGLRAFPENNERQ